MQTSKRLAVLGLAVLCLYLAAVSGWGERLRQSALTRIDEGRMRNVTVLEESGDPPSDPPAALPEIPAAEAVAAMLARAEEDGELPMRVLESVSPEEIRETTIQGGLSLKN